MSNYERIINKQDCHQGSQASHPLNREPTPRISTEMRSITVLVLVGTIAGLLWWNTANGIPGCAQAGYNNNSACPPYGAEVGWYSYCYVSNGRWIASPYRCGLIDPANVTAGYKEFNGTLKLCAKPAVPLKCNATNGTGTMLRLAPAMQVTPILLQPSMAS